MPVKAIAYSLAGKVTYGITKLTTLTRICVGVVSKPSEKFPKSTQDHSKNAKVYVLRLNFFPYIVN